MAFQKWQTSPAMPSPAMLPSPPHPPLRRRPTHCPTPQRTSGLGGLQRSFHIPLGPELSSHPAGLRGWGRGPAWPQDTLSPVWPPGVGPGLTMVSDPVFQAGLGSCPQDTAVPSCSLNDIGNSTLSPAALLAKVHRYWILSGTHDAWGNRTETKDCFAFQAVDKVMTSAGLPGAPRAESSVYSPVQGTPSLRLVRLGKVPAAGGAARNPPL